MSGPTFVEDTNLVEEHCPECGGLVAYFMSCHTWGGREDGSGWRVCMTDCSSAMDFICLGTTEDDEDSCSWDYTWGLNPRNPRSSINESHRPPWLDGPYPW